MLVDKSEGGGSPPLLKNNFPSAVNGCIWLSLGMASVVAKIIDS